VIGHPLVAWVLFAAAMWGTHFSPLFDAALENVWLHDLEHVLYLVSSMLFWMPIVGRDPSPWRLGYPARLLYLFVQMPLNSFLGVAILYSGTISTRTTRPPGACGALRRCRTSRRPARSCGASVTPGSCSPCSC